jgi:hypothetical protein
MGRIRWGFTRQNQDRERRAHPHQFRLASPIPDDNDIIATVRGLNGTVIIELQILDGDEDYELRRSYVLHCNHITTAMELKLRWG